MLFLTLTALALQAGQARQTDTTFTVATGSRLHIENQGGDILVKAWDRNQVRIQASHSRRTHIEISRSGAVIQVEAEAERGPANMVDYELTVPAWMALDLEGMYARISVEGTRAPIRAETLEGDITVKGGAETVTLSSTQGRIVASGARGKIELHTVSEDIEGSDLAGDLVVETISGDILLRGIDSRNADIQAVSGDLYFDGKIVDGGQYSLLTHSGDLAVTVAEGVNATIASAIGSGEVRASFALPSSEHPGRRRQTFRFGNGSATVDLETFSGDVSLLRPAEMAARLERLAARRAQQEARRRARPDREDDDHDIHDLFDHAPRGN